MPVSLCLMKERDLHGWNLLEYISFYMYIIFLSLTTSKNFSRPPDRAQKISYCFTLILINP